MRADPHTARCVPPALVAYQVDYHDDDQEPGAVVLARNPMEARRLGASELDAEEEYCQVRRAPEFDACRTPEDLLHAQLAAGWWFTCGYCERRVSDDGCEDDESEEFAEPAVRGREVYCHEWHAGAEAVERVSRRIRIWDGLAAAAERFPGAVIESVSSITYHQVRTRELVATVSFRVPPHFREMFRWQQGDETMTVNRFGAEEWAEYKTWCAEQGL